MFDMHAGTSSGPARTTKVEGDLTTLQQMFPDLDGGVIRDVYSSCDQDVQRSSLTLLNLTNEDGGDVALDELMADPYNTAGGLDPYQLGSTSLADWASTLETINWQDTVKAVTGTLSTLGANVIQGVSTLADSLQQFVSEISGQPYQPSSPSAHNDGSGRDSYASTSYNAPEGSAQRNNSPFALGSNRVTHRHSITADGDLVPTSPSLGHGDSAYFTKKDD